MTNSGSHWLDLVQWGLGMCESGPIEVWTEGEPFDSRTGRGPNVKMRYPGDIILDLTGDHVPSFVGEKGTLTVDKEARVVSDPPELAREPLDDVDPQAPRGSNHYAHCRSWVEAIKTRQKPSADVEIGHRSATVCHLMNIARFVSERTGQTGERMHWDPQAERFTNSEWGNYFLDRPRRRPYHLPDQV